MQTSRKSIFSQINWEKNYFRFRRDDFRDEFQNRELYTRSLRLQFAGWKKCFEEKVPQEFVSVRIYKKEMVRK